MVRAGRSLRDRREPGRIACSRSVALMANTRVVAIERNGDRVCAVRLQNGTRLTADVVVMNGDAVTAIHAAWKSEGYR